MQSIPYEAQQDDGENRRCGAAALCMVYRSLGIAGNQHDIWNSIATDRQGRRTAKTCFLARHALEHRLAALPVRLARPMVALWHLANLHQVRTILNHRIRPDSSHGHFSVLVDANDREVMIHDPQYGPQRTLPTATLLDLWQCRGADCEITGNIAVLLCREDSRRSGNHRSECNHCHHPVPLDPVLLLENCRIEKEDRLIQDIFCPMCDSRLEWNV